MKKIIFLVIISLNTLADSYIVHVSSEYEDGLIYAKDLSELNEIIIEANLNNVKIKEINLKDYKLEQCFKKIKIGGEGGGDG